MTIPRQALVFRAGRRRVVLGTSLAVIAAILLIGIVPVVATQRTPYGSNLVKNPGFEAGQATDGTVPIAVPYWEVGGNSTVVKYGTSGGFPTAGEGRRISGGKQFFTIGAPTRHGCSTFARQEIFIHGRDARIDSSHVLLNVKAHLGTYDSQSDTAELTVYSGTSTTPLVLLTQTATNDRLVLSTARLVLPPGTRSLVMYLSAEHAVGYCDANFDNVSMKLAHV